MNNTDNKVLFSLLKNIGLENMQDVDEYILTLTSHDSKNTLSRSGCLTRCFLLYLMKHNAFKYEIDTKNEKNIFIFISEDAISTMYEILKISKELEDLITSGSKYGILLISNNRQKLLEKIQ